ncbi:MAG: hypothetical protein M3441_04195 [Chloroflexota bacterium]|nr:hypothetical protein [Chloroflexota bacterium]
MSFRRKPPLGNVKRVEPHGNSSRGVVTNKAGRTVQYGSFAQRRLILTFERDRTVLDYASLPERIDYRDASGTLRSYVPHFIVWRVNGQVEWHHLSRTRQDNDPDHAHHPQHHHQYQAQSLAVREEQSAARQVCGGRGWLYVVHTDECLPQDTYLANLQALEMFKPACYRDEEVAEAVTALLEAHGPVLYSRLAEDVAGAMGCALPQVLETVAHMLWHCELESDMNRLLLCDGCFDRKVVIRLPIRDDHAQGLAG